MIDTRLRNDDHELFCHEAADGRLVLGVKHISDDEVKVYVFEDSSEANWLIGRLSELRDMMLKEEKEDDEEAEKEAEDTL